MAMSRGNESKERESQHVLRKDMVWFGGVGYHGFWPDTPRRSPGGIMHLSVMVVTDGHLIFEPPIVSFLHRLSRFLWLIPPFSFLILLWGMPPLSRTAWFAFSRIDRFHTWTPAFSGPVMFEVGAEAWQFWLLRDGPPWKHPAAKEAMREHFDVIERAWKAARGAIG